MTRTGRDHIQAEKKLFMAQHVCRASVLDLPLRGAAILLLPIFLYSQVDRLWLLLWVAANLAMLLHRLWTVASLKKRKKNVRGKIGAALTHLFSGVLLSGVVFGSAGYFLYPQDSIPHQALLTLILGTTATLTVDASVPSPRMAVAYPLLMVGPVILASLFGSGDHQHFLALLGVVYLGVQVFYSMRLSRYFAENLSLQLDNMELTSELIHEVSGRLAAEKMLKGTLCGRDA